MKKILPFVIAAAVLLIAATGNRGGPIQGTSTNDNAAVGQLGEYVSSVIVSGSAVSLASGSNSNVTSISLTAGDWDVCGVVDFHAGTGTATTYFQAGTSISSGTFGAQDTYGVAAVAIATNTVDMNLFAPVTRVSISGTANIYLVGNAGFSISTLTAYGTLRARRVR